MLLVIVMTIIVIAIHCGFLLLLLKLKMWSTCCLLGVDLNRRLAVVNIVIFKICLLYFLSQATQVRLNLLSFHCVDSHTIVGTWVNYGSTCAWIIALSRLS